MSTGVPDTLMLLERWHGGDRDALGMLLVRDLEWIRARVARRLGPLLRELGEAEDYVQDTMLRVLSSGPKFRVSDREHFRGLMALLIENTLRDRYQYHRRQRRDPAQVRELPRDTVLDLDPPRRDVTRPSAIADRNERHAFLHLAMDLLPAADREIMRLRDWEELPFAEIGALIGTTEQAARMRYRRALPRLARLLLKLREGRLGEVLGAQEDD